MFLVWLKAYNTNRLQMMGMQHLKGALHLQIKSTHYQRAIYPTVIFSWTVRAASRPDHWRWNQTHNPYRRVRARSYICILFRRSSRAMALAQVVSYLLFAHGSPGVDINKGEEGSNETVTTPVSNYRHCISSALLTKKDCMYVSSIEHCFW